MVINEVRVFDGKGKLKHIIPAEEVMELSEAQFLSWAGITGRKRVREFKDYTCTTCRKKFQSKSTKGAKYCVDCRQFAYKRGKRSAKAKPKLKEN